MKVVLYIHNIRLLLRFVCLSRVW